MDSNIYWSIYKNIEKEFNSLMFNIHIDDNQLNVYSSKIIDLIIRSSAEIESIAKELYKINGGIDKHNLKYDVDALLFLNNLWNLDKKVVIISSYNCFVSNKIISPFTKNEIRTGSKDNRLTYTWNNSYQNLKHNRAKSLKFGTIKYLFDVTAALYILNLYYKNLKFELGKDSNGQNFDTSFGSIIYSIKTHKNAGMFHDREYAKNQDFDECVYLIKPTINSYKKVQEILKKIDKETKTRVLEEILLISRDKVENSETLEFSKNKLDEIIHKNKFGVALKEHGLDLYKATENLYYDAIINKNQY
ncbi:MAG: hypothetical protein Q8R22_03485 [Flavobacterium sp.]|uniref:hypothetical protein n=1 Tax=Flavobacterium sp. TaxID=239 RepID=UPI002734E0AF|nr:hypothetical protein [Flavobacterium sp.]MDP3679880.1 hypothetical protein [Flavobacterium sp.]